jgi:hypothetical protein
MFRKFTPIVLIVASMLMISITDGHAHSNHLKIDAVSTPYHDLTLSHQEQNRILNRQDIRDKNECLTTCCDNFCAVCCAFSFLSMDVAIDISAPSKIKFVTTLLYLDENPIAAESPPPRS